MKPGFSPGTDTCKRHKLSNVVDHTNPFAVSDVGRIEHGEFGSVTGEIEELVARKMQVLGPYFAKYPRLVNQCTNVVNDEDEDTSKFQDQLNTGLTYHNVKDLEGENSGKDVHSAPIPVVIHIESESDVEPIPVVIHIESESDVEDDVHQKSIVPFHEALEEEDDRHNKSIVLFHEALGEEDDRCIIPFREVVLPRPVVPSPIVMKTVVSFSLV